MNIQIRQYAVRRDDYLSRLGQWMDQMGRQGWRMVSWQTHTLETDQIFSIVAVVVMEREAGQAIVPDIPWPEPDAAAGSPEAR